jgi:hypothetical protein
VTIAALTVTLGALAVASGVIPTPDVGTLLARATSSIGAWMYVGAVLAATVLTLVEGLRHNRPAQE